ncbi:MAG: phenylacetate--CoA ligase family protein [Theionarchaea archaeon]|nr:phenylacetate--CoA ligase family protein [Theionarchaea archaeon]
MLPRMLSLIWQIRKEQFFPLENLETIQEKRLQEMVTHAYMHTQFYRTLFDQLGITPEKIKTREDLKELPPTKKTDLQETFNSMVAEGYSEENCRAAYTAGSTGIPAKILYDPYTMDYFTAESMVEFLDTGYYPWEKVAYTKRTTWKSHILQKVGLLRAYHINTTLPEEEQALMLREINPSLIASYPSLLYAITRIVAKEKYTINPRAVILGGEMLTPHVRTSIEEIFRTRVIETYATIEFSTIARECPQGNWHINSTQCVVEFEKGKLLVTGLINKALPLIRYEIGDSGRPKEGLCPCGRGHPMMHILEGRSGDIFILPDGREVPPIRVWGVRLLLDTTLAAKKYQIIQEDTDYFIIKIVPTEKFTEDIEKRAREELIRNLGYPVIVEIEQVDEIPLIDDRKLRVNISKVRRSVS